MQEPGAKTAQIITPRPLVAHVIANPGASHRGRSRFVGRRPAFGRGCASICGSLSVHAGKIFLQWAYPIHERLGAILRDLLIEEPKHHWSSSAPRIRGKWFSHGGRDGCGLHGANVMHQMVRYLFGACIESSKILGVDGISEMN